MDPQFETIYRENSKYVYNVALGILRSKDEAEDVMQNVFIKLFENFSSFRGDSSLKTYLYRMTVNRSIDYIRSQSLRAGKLEQMEIEESKTPDSSRALLDSLLEKLAPELKVPVLLAEIGGFSYKEISKIMNINIGTVKSRINRGIIRIREIAAKEGVL
jgi:RNA polymerase sigma-70 factor (ECF subfamily)